MSKYVDFDEVNATALQYLEYLLKEWIPDGRVRGREFIAGSWSGGKGESLSIHMEKGTGGDFATDDFVGDPIGIYGKIFGVDRITAALALADRLGINSESGFKKNKTPNKPASDDKQDSEQEKQAKIDKIISECVSLRNTPAQQYLKNRGIKGCNTNIFKFRPHKSGGGSLVCIGTDDKGAVRVIQQVYITKDGYKNPDAKVKKRTNGFPSGNPILIPTRNGNSPIIVCEGPEDGITLSNATGFEVWISCGLAFMSKIPFIKDRQFIIARDNDPPDSDPDVRMNKVMITLMDRGFNLLCARPPEGIKDANELLQKAGLEAVADMINQSQPVLDYSSYEDDEPPPPGEEYAPEDDKENSEENAIFRKCAFFPHTDTGNAMRICERWSSVVKFAEGVGWLVCEKGKWHSDLGDSRALKMAICTAEDIKKEIDFASEHYKDASKKWAKKSQGSSQISAALKLAKAFLTISSSDLDRNPFFFNCANGVINLKAGELLKHENHFMLTKQSKIHYASDSPCPNWEKFLKEIFPDDPEIIPFIQRAVGYSLTGDTREQCMFILHGTGSNGKSTFIETLQAVMGDFWIKTNPEAFMERVRSSDTNPFLAMLRGARFVTASETKSDRSLDEAIVKEVTGDTFITTRTVFQTPFTFTPQFKLWFATNHKPEIRGTDEGIWRRLRLIPFKARFYDKTDPDAPEYGPFKDKMLTVKLKAELPGILAWAVKGCLDWQKKDDLLPPQVVFDATNEYRSEMDVIGAFLNECCQIKFGDWTVTVDKLYVAYKKWCEDNGHKPLSKNKLGRRLTERNIIRGWDHRGERAYMGIVLKENQS